MMLPTNPLMPRKGAKPSPTPIRFPLLLLLMSWSEEELLLLS